MKLHACPQLADMGDDFRVHPSAAPLKHDENYRQEWFDKTLPRSSERGPIEAVSANESKEVTTSLPRSSERGPIEAI